MAGFITAVQAEHADEAGQSDKVISDKFEAGTDILGDGLDGMLVKDSGGTAQVKIGEGASGGKASINEDGKVQELQDESSSIVEAAKTLLKLNQVKVGKDALGTDLEGIEIQNDSGTPVVQLGELSSGTYGLKATEGEFELVTSNLTIGKDALGSGLAGININDKIKLGELSSGTYGLEANDALGREVWSDNKFKGPKVIDYGVASLLGSEQADHVSNTYPNLPGTEQVWTDKSITVPPHTAWIANVTGGEINAYSFGSTVSDVRGHGTLIDGRFFQDTVSFGDQIKNQTESSNNYTMDLHVSNQQVIMADNHNNDQWAWGHAIWQVIEIPI